MLIEYQEGAAAAGTVSKLRALMEERGARLERETPYGILEVQDGSFCGFGAKGRRCGLVFLAPSAGAANGLLTEALM